MHNFDKPFRLGLYEKALPNSLDWEEKILMAKELGFDFIEISVDESDERLQRLDWSDDEIYRLRHLCEKYGLPLLDKPLKIDYTTNRKGAGPQTTGSLPGDQEK